MKEHLKSSFSSHFAMVFMALIIFSTNEFTLKHPVVNIILSILLIGIYLILFYIDAFKNTSIRIRNGKKPVTPVFASVILYIIPVLLLVWLQAAPMEYGSWLPEETEETAQVEVSQESADAEEPELIYHKKGIRQQAWFELYMQPFKGVYRLTDNNIAVEIISMLLAPIFALLGYINAKRGVDIMKKAEDRFRKMMYKNEDEF